MSNVFKQIWETPFEKFCVASPSGPLSQDKSFCVASPNGPLSQDESFCVAFFKKRLGFGATPHNNAVLFGSFSCGYIAKKKNEMN